MRERRVVIRKRRTGLAQRGAGIAAVDERLDVARRRRQHRIEGEDRFRRPLEIDQHVAEIVERVEMAGRKRQRLVECASASSLRLSACSTSARFDSASGERG